MRGGHILVETRNGMIVDTEVEIVAGSGKSAAGHAMLERLSGNHRVTVAADKGNDKTNIC
ncbi:MAG: hypothetical protein MPN21_19100 [Thermoanaerobaculia bacterium]|nr:hypothetical protein [Thermoanaerobaculia bacterium]